MKIAAVMGFTTAVTANRKSNMRISINLLKGISLHLL